MQNLKVKVKRTPPLPKEQQLHNLFSQIGTLSSSNFQSLFPSLLQLAQKVVSLYKLSDDPEEEFPIYILLSLQILRLNHLEQEISEEHFDQIAEVAVQYEGQLAVREDWILLLCALTENKKSLEKAQAFLDDFCNELEQQDAHPSQDLNSQRIQNIALVEIISVVMEFKLEDSPPKQSISHLSEILASLFSKVKIDNQHSYTVQVLLQFCKYTSNPNLFSFVEDILIASLIQQVPVLNTLLEESKQWEHNAALALSVFSSLDQNLKQNKSQLNQFLSLLKSLHNYPDFQNQKRQFVGLLERELGDQIPLQYILKELCQLHLSQNYSYFVEYFKLEASQVRDTILQLIDQKLFKMNRLEEVLILSTLRPSFDGLVFQQKIVQFELSLFHRENVKYLGNYSAFAILRCFYPYLASDDESVNSDPLFGNFSPYHHDAHLNHKIKAFLGDLVCQL